MTTRPATFDKSVIRSSVIPSEKYARSASPLMLSKGSTAIDGLPDGAGVAAGDGRLAVAGTSRSSVARCHPITPAAISRAAPAAANHASRRDGRTADGFVGAADGF